MLSVNIMKEGFTKAYCKSQNVDTERISITSTDNVFSFFSLQLFTSIFPSFQFSSSLFVFVGPLLPSNVDQQNSVKQMAGCESGHPGDHVCVSLCVMQTNWGPVPTNIAL